MIKKVVCVRSCVWDRTFWGKFPLGRPDKYGFSNYTVNTIWFFHKKEWIFFDFVRSFNEAEEFLRKDHWHPPGIYQIVISKGGEEGVTVNVSDNGGLMFHELPKCFILRQRAYRKGWQIKVVAGSPDGGLSGVSWKWTKKRRNENGS